MQPAEMTLVSTGDHVVEPPGLFEEHFPEALREQAPRLCPDAAGVMGWTFQGARLGVPGAGVVRRLDADGPRGAGAGYDELPLSAYDSAARVAAMDRDGVWAGLSYPSFAGFSGARLHSLPDAALSRAVVSAYNDWQAAWSAEQPGRLVPLAVLPVWDVDAAAAEVDRIADLGITAVAFPESPADLDLPGFATDRWDPLLARLCEHDVALCLQASAVELEPGGGGMNPFAAMGGLLAPQAAATACTDIVVSGVLGRFPDLRIATGSGGIGWIPFLLDRIDLHLENQVWTKLDLGAATGTEVFRKHFLGCFTSDPSSLFLRERIGVDAIAWAGAFPHGDSLWPGSPEAVAAELLAAGVPDDDCARITWRNSARFLRVEMPQDLSGTTVGSLRAGAA